MRRRPPARVLAGAAVIAAIAVAAIAGPAVLSHDPGHVSLRERFARPSGAHLAGADNLGRDVLARSIHGARVSLLVGVAVVAVALTIGLLAGTAAGTLGGAVDTAVMRIVDVLMAFPGILLAIALVAVLGPSLLHALVALCAVGWVGYARLARAQALRLRELDYVQAARALGASEPRIALRHVMPNLMGPMIVQASLGIGGAILSEAGLSFLGLSVQPPTPSWGTMLNEGRVYFDVPHLTLLPGALLAATVLAFNVLGDGLRDWLDVRGES